MNKFKVGDMVWYFDIKAKVRRIDRDNGYTRVHLTEIVKNKKARSFSTDADYLKPIQREYAILGDA